MRTYKSLQNLTSDEIEAHILDPESHPLPERCQEQFSRVMTAARLMDSHPDDGQVAKLLQEKYPVSQTTCRRDIALARQLYKTQHTFDWDFWRAWMIRDQIDLIEKCREKKDFKTWNKAKETLRRIIGDKPEGVEDPRRMEKNLFLIQVVNQAGERHEINLSEVRDWKPSQVKALIDNLTSPIDTAEAEEIINT